jgi:outer membrane murein-binding lipoprotein Lpp
MLNDVHEAAIISMGVAATASTITRASIFEWLRGLAMYQGKWAEKLATCPYCLGHWLALAAVLWWQPRLVNSGAGPGAQIMDFAMTTMAVVCANALLCGLIQRATWPNLHSGLEGKVESLEEDNDALREALGEAKKVILKLQGEE